MIKQICSHCFSRQAHIDEAKEVNIPVATHSPFVNLVPGGQLQRTLPFTTDCIRLSGHEQLLPDGDRKHKYAHFAVEQSLVPRNKGHLVTSILKPLII